MYLVIDGYNFIYFCHPVNLEILIHKIPLCFWKPDNFVLNYQAFLKFTVIKVKYFMLFVNFQYAPINRNGRKTKET